MFGGGCMTTKVSPGASGSASYRPSSSQISCHRASTAFWSYISSMQRILRSGERRSAGEHGSATGRVTLHAAGVRGGLQLSLSRATAVTRPSDQGRLTVTSWPRARSSAIASSPSLDSTASEPSCARRGKNELGKWSVWNSGASIAAWRSAPKWTWRRKTCSDHWSCWSPPGVPKASRDRRHGTRGRGAASSGDACAARARTAALPPARTSARACRAASRAPGWSASRRASRRSASPRRGCRSGRRRPGGRCRS